MRFKIDQNVLIIYSDAESEVGQGGIIVGFTGVDEYPYWVKLEDGDTVGFAENDLDFA